MLCLPGRRLRAGQRQRSGRRLPGAGRGAYVCYDCWGTYRGNYRNWGHIGLSLGDGRVVHTWGEVRVDDYLAIQKLDAPGWTKPSYIGWVPVPAILRGMSEKPAGGKP